jgi:hypothetical protein
MLALVLLTGPAASIGQRPSADPRPLPTLTTSMRLTVCPSKRRRGAIPCICARSSPTTTLTLSHRCCLSPTPPASLCFAVLTAGGSFPHGRLARNNRRQRRGGFRTDHKKQPGAIDRQVPSAGDCAQGNYDCAAERRGGRPVGRDRGARPFRLEDGKEGRRNHRGYGRGLQQPDRRQNNAAWQRNPAVQSPATTAVTAAQLLAGDDDWLKSRGS